MWRAMRWAGGAGSVSEEGAVPWPARSRAMSSAAQPEKVTLSW